MINLRLHFNHLLPRNFEKKLIEKGIFQLEHFLKVSLSKALLKPLNVLGIAQSEHKALGFFLITSFEINVFISN